VDEPDGSTPGGPAPAPGGRAPALVGGWTPRREPVSSGDGPAAPAAAAPPGAPAHPPVREDPPGPARPSAPPAPDTTDTTLTRDSADLRARWQQDALGHARDSYVERHGSPLGRPDVLDVPPRRWPVPVRLGLVAGLAVLLVAGAVGLRAASAFGPSPATAVVLPEVAGPPGAEGGEPAPSGGTGASPQPSASAAGLVVHVVGQVAGPGLLELAAGSRVADAIDAAGGPLATADLAALNLARTLTDGEQVVVPAIGDPPLPGSESGSPGTPDTSRGPVDLNRATLDELDALSGIGPVLADRIVAWREEHGTFTSVDELTEVEGIGPALLERLRPAVRV
jgi:competence protein ComEA